MSSALLTRPTALKASSGIRARPMRNRSATKVCQLKINKMLWTLRGYCRLLRQIFIHRTRTSCAPEVPVSLFLHFKSNLLSRAASSCHDSHHSHKTPNFSICVMRNPTLPQVEAAAAAAPTQEKWIDPAFHNKASTSGLLDFLYILSHTLSHTCTSQLGSLKVWCRTETALSYPTCFRSLILLLTNKQGV